MKTHSTRIYVVHPKPGVTSTKLQHHIIFFQKADYNRQPFCCHNFLFIFQDCLHFRTPTHRVYPTFLLFASAGHFLAQAKNPHSTLFWAAYPKLVKEHSNTTRMFNACIISLSIISTIQMEPRNYHLSLISIMLTTNI